MTLLHVVKEHMGLETGSGAGRGSFPKRAPETSDLVVVELEPQVRRGVVTVTTRRIGVATTATSTAAATATATDATATAAAAVAAMTTVHRSVAASATGGIAIAAPAAVAAVVSMMLANFLFFFLKF